MIAKDFKSVDYFFGTILASYANTKPINILTVGFIKGRP